MNKTNNYFISYKKNHNSKLKLFCFPYAGGNAAIFKSWVEYLPDNIELLAAELPGHGYRFSEKAIDNIRGIVEVFSRSIISLLDKPYMFFGHSMGATLAFEITKKLRASFFSIPKHIFISGRQGPRYDEDEIRHLLPTDKFKEYLLKKGGTSPELLNNQELMDCVLPMLRADHKAVETYLAQYQQEPPLDCPVTVFSGTEDDVSKEQLEDWRKETKKEFNITYLPGNHFFIFSQQKQVIAEIMSKISKII